MSNQNIKLQCLDNNDELFVIDSVSGISNSHTGPSTNSSTGSMVLRGGLSIMSTANATSSTSGGALTIRGGLAVAGNFFVSGAQGIDNVYYTNSTINSLVTNDINFGVASFFSGSATGLNNVSTPTNVSGLAFTNANIRSFTANITINMNRSSGGNLFETFILEGIQNDSGWILLTTGQGDITGITFSITSSGQVQYTGTNMSNWVSTTFRYFVTQISTNGSYQTMLSSLTTGNLLFNNIQITDTTDAINGLSSGGFTTLGGASIEKGLVVKSTIDSTSKTEGGSLTVLGGTSIAKNLIVGLNISAGTLSATTLVSSANVSTNLITSGTARIINIIATGSNHTIGSIIVSGGNVGIGTIEPLQRLQVDGNILLQNYKDGFRESANKYIGVSSVNGSVGVNGFTGIAIMTTTPSTIGGNVATSAYSQNIFFWNHRDGGGNTAATMVLTNNRLVGINTDSPEFTLDVNGTARFSTGLTTGTLTATSSTIPNAVSTNISTGTLSATSYTVPNAVSTNISTGTIRASGVGYYSDNITFPIGKGISFNNGYRTNNGSYALYADNVASNSPIRLVGSSDSGIQRPFQIGHFSSDNAASTWNSQFSVNTFSGSLTASFNSNTIGNIITTGGNVGIGTATPTRQLSLTGDFAMDNAKVMYAKNSAGTEEIFFWPRWTDNMTYLNYGSGGFNIRNNTSTTIMFLTNGGNVGIGTQSPGVKLDVVGGPYDPTIRCNSSKDAIISLKATNNRDYWIGSGADTGGIPAPLANNCFFIYDNTAGAVRFVVDSTGSIGIGTTSPTYKLDVNGTTRLNSTVLVGGRFEIDTTRFVVGVDGNVGIGTASPQGKLDVVGSVSNFSIFRGGASDANSKTTLNAVNANCMLMSSMSGSTMFFYGRDTGTNYRNTWAASTYFTGQHGNKPIDGEEYLKSNLTDYVGLIVSSADDGFYSVNPITKEELTGKDAINISEALPKIKLTTVDQDKSVWGVITNVKNDNYNVDGTFDTDDNTEWSDRLEGSVRINGLGEGAIWISNINGNIENGDYICSSLIPGYGKRQNDDLLHNYTVAKATCSVNFTNLEELETKFNLRYLQPDGTLITKQEYLSGLASNENVYIAAFIGCTYHCS